MSTKTDLGKDQQTAAIRLTKSLDLTNPAEPLLSNQQQKAMMAARATAEA